MDAQQLLDYVIKPTLKQIDLDSENAQRLLLGTACQESACGRYLHQSEGPAIGIFQMEPATYYSLWLDFLAYHEDLATNVRKLSLGRILDNAEEMHGNLFLATAMCRIKYLADPEPIPDNLPAQAGYYKRVYNTGYGSATVRDYINNWERFARSVRFTDGIV